MLRKMGIFIRIGVFFVLLGLFMSLANVREDVERIRYTRIGFVSVLLGLRERGKIVLVGRFVEPMRNTLRHRGNVYVRRVLLLLGRNVGSVLQVRSQMEILVLAHQVTLITTRKPTHAKIVASRTNNGSTENANALQAGHGGTKNADNAPPTATPKQISLLAYAEVRPHTSTRKPIPVLSVGSIFRLLRENVCLLSSNVKIMRF